ncbi:MAG: tRNA (N(6)-L-threonylcarbamoyladenosine(37)-C(2))-methylthiotransferase MtaB [Candidatus Krumholzibacteriia bacterium]
MSRHRHAPATTSGPSPRVAFRTLGCRLNQVDTEGLRAALAERFAVTAVPWDSAADVYVINSCTVTSRAEQECRRLARQVRRREPLARVVVVGCYAQTQPQVLARLPEVDAVVGAAVRDAVEEWFPAVARGDDKVVSSRQYLRDEPFHAPMIASFAGRSRAFVKVQDGCDLRCSYCAIWQARGPARSRAADEVLAQMANLRASGYRELVLVGVHLGSYGRDRRERDGLTGLLRAAVAAHPDLRLRLGSIHPDEVTGDLLALMADHPQVRPHLHISLQSGDDAVLGRMRRPYRGAQARSAVERAARRLPGCGIGADLIVGFPGETDAEFAATLAMVGDLPFTYLHVFRYSPRPGTVAAALPGRVHAELTTERSRVLRALGRRKRRAFARTLVGTWREAVVESVSGDGRQRLATTDNYVSVSVPPDAGTEGGLVRLCPQRLRGERLETTAVATLVGGRMSGAAAAALEAR